jgi:aspartyl-tRNA(Asn)/glutamyl-tRNA(Gln) amidotransferase subunit B
MAVAEAEKQSLSKSDAASRIANWILSDIKHILIREGISFSAIGSFKLNPRRFACLVVMVAQGQVSMKNAKQALDIVFKQDQEPERIIQEQGWEQLTDPGKIGEAVQSVYAEEAGVFTEIRAAIAGGNRKRQHTLTAYLVGKVLEKTGGRADPKIAGTQIGNLIQSK